MVIKRGLAISVQELGTDQLAGTHFGDKVESTRLVVAAFNALTQTCVNAVQEPRSWAQLPLTHFV